MKKCKKSHPEPDCLSSFRNNNPNGTWDQFRDQAAASYDLIRDVTYKDQCGLCCYCELDLENQNQQIAHFHPKGDKSSNHNWALDWDNLFLACKGGSQTWMANPDHYCPPLPENLSCDEKKGSQILDGRIFSPCEIPAFPRIFRYEQYENRIEIHADEKECVQSAISVDKVEQTIQEFNLNCSRLSTARLALHRQLEKAIRLIRENNIDPKRGLESLVSRYLAKDRNGNWQRFFTLVRWRLGKTAEEYLRSINYDG